MVFPRCHLEELKDLFKRVRPAELTIKPSKFMVHQVGKRKLEMLQDQVDTVALALSPHTKKQLRAF